MRAALDFVSNLLDSTNKRTSLRLFCYALVIVAAIVWLSIDLRRGISTEWVAAFAVLIGAVTGAKLAGAKIQGSPKGDTPE